MLVDRYRKPFIVYTTSEQKTGEKWIDGKPIYTLTFHKNYDATYTLNDTVTFDSLGISNIDNVFIDGNNSFVKYFSGSSYLGTQPVNINAEGDYKACYLRSNGVAFRINQPGNYSTKWYVTLRYTKTTD